MHNFDIVHTVPSKFSQDSKSRTISSQTSQFLDRHDDSSPSCWAVFLTLHAPGEERASVTAPSPKQGRSHSRWGKAHNRPEISMLQGEHRMLFFFSFKLFILYCGIQQINNVMIVSGEQQERNVSSLPQTPLPSRLPHNTEQSTLCYTVSPCWLSIFNTAVCTGPSQTP